VLLVFLCCVLVFAQLPFNFFFQVLGLATHGSLPCVDYVWISQTPGPSHMAAHHQKQTKQTKKRNKKDAL